jgi:methylthioribose-1-phosphate isomerase
MMTDQQTTSKAVKEDLQTIRWREGRPEMIDQRALPAYFAYLSADSAASVANAIRTMVVRGAPAIGVAAAYGVAMEAVRCSALPQEQYKAAMEQSFKMLAASRPTAVNLFWALERMLRDWEASARSDHAQQAARLLEEAHEVYVEDIRINQQMGAYVAELLADGARVLTNSNAGALATAPRSAYFARRLRPVSTSACWPTKPAPYSKTSSLALGRWCRKKSPSPLSRTT